MTNTPSSAGDDGSTWLHDALRRAADIAPEYQADTDPVVGHTHRSESASTVERNGSTAGESGTAADAVALTEALTSTDDIDSDLGRDIFDDTDDSDDTAAADDGEAGIFGAPRLTPDGIDLDLRLGGDKPHNVENVTTAEDIAALRAVDAELNTRWPETDIDPDLSRVELLCDMLGSPEKSFSSIHVAGTNGKTSTVRMIDALLRAFHRRTGRTTSPHLQEVTERIAVDGQPVDARTFVDTWEEIKPFVEMVDAQSAAAGGPPMSKFEVLVAIAYSVFAAAPVEVAAVEVGMGGKWDATNVIDSEVAVIMPIGLDHTNYLGDTIPQIAQEKAGIIKPRPVADDNYTEPKDNVVIVGQQDPEALEVIMSRAAECDCMVARFGLEFGVVEQTVAVGGQQLVLQGLGGVYDDIFLPLSGIHQAHNAACALAAVEAFFGAGSGRQLDVDAVRAGFASVTSPGRLEKVRSSPSVFVDATHNPHGARALGESLAEDFAFRKLVGVVGVLGDKDAAGILGALEPYFHEIVCTQPVSPRALDAYELADIAREIFGEERVHTDERLEDAVSLAVSLAEDTSDGQPMSGAGVVVTGSVVTAGQARALFGQTPE